jgi:hypothetical protein
MLEINLQIYWKIWKLLNVDQAVNAAPFPIPPEAEIYQISKKDKGLEDYLMQYRIPKDKNDCICLFCNSQLSTTFPLFFESKQTCLAFETAVLTYQLYHQYLLDFTNLK